MLRCFLLLLILLNSCAFFKKLAGPKRSFNPESEWKEDYQAQTDLFKEKNPFFSFESKIIKEKGFTKINFIPLSSPGDKFRYDFNVSSGKPFLVGQSCSQNDVWEKYRGEVSESPFYEGIVPGMLNRWGRPQKIIVFGKKKKKDLKNHELKAIQVRLLGMVMETFCDEFPCANGWSETEVLIGVLEDGRSYSRVEKLAKLKKVTDYEYLMAYLNNYKGRSISNVREYPAYRYGPFKGMNSTLRYLKEEAFVFKKESSQKILKGCKSLFGIIQSRVMNMKKVQRLYDAGVVKQSELIKDDLLKLMKDLSQRKTKRRLKVCLEISDFDETNMGIEDKWFFRLFQISFHLHDIGYHYSCSRKVWERMRLNIFAHAFASKSCRRGDVDEGLDKVTTFLELLQKRNQDYFKYIEYDSGVGGTHERVYDWVYDRGKRVKCSSGKNNIPDREVFPNDITWTKIERPRELKRTLFVE